jgi:integrase/recombinase XerD
MNTLREAVTDYLAMRRGLGFKLYYIDKALFRFVSFMESRGASYITSRLALEWTQQSDCSCEHWARRLSWVRGFASYRSATDPRTEILPTGLWGFVKRRARPYLYTKHELKRLLQAAQQLKSCSIMKGRTYNCLFGLLAVSGMRIGEALNLSVKDVDLTFGIVTVKGSKFGQSRLVPLHASSCKVLSDYKKRRDKFLGDRPCEYFFISNIGKQLRGNTVRKVFIVLCKTIGLDRTDPKTAPRIHDLRHNFAVQTMLRWYRNGEDVGRKLPVLSTYLGHVRLKDTYWYLSVCPELMGLAVKRLDQRWEVKS